MAGNPWQSVILQWQNTEVETESIAKLTADRGCDYKLVTWEIEPTKQKERLDAGERSAPSTE